MHKNQHNYLCGISAVTIFLITIVLTLGIHKESYGFLNMYLIKRPFPPNICHKSIGTKLLAP